MFRERFGDFLVQHWLESSALLVPDQLGSWLQCPVRLASLWLWSRSSAIWSSHDPTGFSSSHLRVWRSEVAQSCPTFCDPWTLARQAPPSTGFSSQEYWSGLPFPSPEDLPDPGINPKYRTQVSHIAGRRFTFWAMRGVYFFICICNMYFNGSFKSMLDFSTQIWRKLVFCKWGWWRTGKRRSSVLLLGLLESPSACWHPKGNPCISKSVSERKSKFS